MSQTIVINSTHWTGDRFQYQFPSPQKFTNKLVALQGMNLNNQFYNISSDYGNTSILFKWFDDSTYTFNLANPSNQSLTSINYNLQQQMIANNLYAITASGDFVYFMQVAVNTVTYGCDITFAAASSALATSNSWSKPSGASWNWPGTAKTPQITINDGFGDLVGFPAGSYPSVQTATVTVSNSKTPNIIKVSSLIICCNLINNFGISNPTNVLTSIPVSAGFAEQINIQNSSLTYAKVSNNQYDKIEIVIYDQEIRKQILFDTDVLITLSLIDG